MVRLQVLDADYTILDNKPLIRLFCKTKEGKPVCVFHRNFLPYMYAKPRGDPQAVTDLLKQRFAAETVNIERVERFLPIGYSKEPAQLLKITLKTPSKVPEAKEALKSVADMYEADVLFKYRFFADFGIRAMEWIDVEGTAGATSTVYNPILDASAITPVESDEDAPLKWLSIDIECVPVAEAGMADAEKDPVIMISMVFDPDHRGRKSIVLAARGGMKDAECFAGEKEMLQAFADKVREYDPDILIGYNIQNFDLPYLLKRMEVHGVERKIGRADKTMMTRMLAGKQTTDVVGRVVVDPYVILRKPDSTYRFKRYNLNTVAKELLGEEKIEVDHKEMRKAWLNGENMDHYVAYCRKDAVLALDIVQKNQFLERYTAISRLSGVTLQDAINGGQSTRIENLLLREFNKRDFVIPLKPQATGDEDGAVQYKGGLVLDPEKGLHTDGCIIVLDFKSLYPSIISTFNICPTTLVTGETSLKCHIAPSGSKFVDQEVRRGIVPGILDHLIDERSAVKKKMKNVDGRQRAILDAKQYAFKIMTNSFYGYLGYARARTYNTEVAAAVTAYGRFLIGQTRDTIGNMGYRVVYGDTDSVMVKAPTRNLDEAHDIGAKMAHEITESLPGKLELDFEKIFRSFLILTKKRYAGWAFEKGSTGWKDKIEMKGIETVRRDWCDLVSETMETVINIILKEGDVNKAISLVKEQVEHLKKGDVDLYKLSITKGLTKSIDAYDGMLPHVDLARRMKKRDPTTAPTPGDRIPFVIISGNALLSHRAEDPEYIKAHALRIDSDYYIESQLLPPLERIFAVMGIGKTELTGGGRQVSLFELMNGTKVKRTHDVSFELSPEKTVVTNPEGFSCATCKASYRRVPLTGRCDCGGEMYAFGGGMLGKSVLI